VMWALSAFVCIRLFLNSDALCMYCTCAVVPLFAVSGHEGLWIMITVLCLACSIVASLGALQRCSTCTVADTPPPVWFAMYTCTADRLALQVR
jgi:hypothetical protein